MTDVNLHDLIAQMIRNWGPESPDEPGAADRLADHIIGEVEAVLALPPKSVQGRIASALERIATIAEENYRDSRGRGARLPKVRR